MRTSLIGSGILAATLTITSCASKTVAARPAPYFAASPARQTTNAVDAGDSDLEIGSLRADVAAHPDDVEVRLRLAQAYAAHGFPDIALEHLRLAAGRFPASLPVALHLARSLRQAGQEKEALDGLNAFVHAHPQASSEPYEWLGILNDDARDWKAAQSAYETALLYAPSSAELHNNLGYALLMQHLNHAAASEFRASLRLQHNSTIARNNLGIALAGDPTLDRKEAILNWQAAAGPAVAHNNMAAVLIERGDLAGARQELETALSYDRQNGPALYNLALVSERDGKPAVIQASAMQVPKQPGVWARIFHPQRSSAPPRTVTQTPVATAGKSVPPVIVPAGSGN